LAMEANRIRDVRREPLKVLGYSVGFRKGAARVRIEVGRYLDLRAYFADIATKRSKAVLDRELYELPWGTYAPVRGQYLSLFRLINERRGAANLPSLSSLCVPMKRRIFRPFEDQGCPPTSDA